MVIEKLSIISLFLVLFLFLLQTSVFPAYASGEAHLKDISGVAIFTENFSNSVGKDLLNLKDLEKILEKKLRDSRIDFYEKSQWRNKIGGAYIKFKIVSSKLNKVDSYAVYIDLELYRSVVVLSPKLGENKSIFASTWSTGKLHPCIIEGFQQCIEKGSTDLLNIFINEYKSVNGIN